MPTNDSISILDGSTFVVSDTHGDIEAGPDQVQGLFYRDTRFLSRWILTVHGRRPDILSVENGKYFEAQFFLYPPTGTIYENPYLSVIRKRKVGDGFHEDITVFNHGNERKQVEIRLEADADFADLFEVKDALAKKGDLYREVRDDVLVLGYRRDDFVRETLITSGEPVQITVDGFAFNLTLEPQSEWNTCIDIRPVAEETVEAVKYGHDAEDAHPNMALTLEQWIDEAPSLSSDADDVQHVYGKSLVDLAALRFYSLLFPGESPRPRDCPGS